MYRLVLRHPQTPWLAKALLGLAIGYLLLPFDLIPDFIPVLGQLDDLVIVPGLIYLGLKCVPESLIQECRQQVAAANLAPTPAQD
ncbi:YkvA family protein [Methylobacillus caricis]|uniref:YkvA family protein n=1 Tax=Methylobacillus caricis TaxID=1971611 RepID=UPI00299EACA7|nr:YkvA family protein [Methylobacillus caricis]